ncbi:MAG: c-type cytochrome [Polyangiales bacterium]
MRIFVMAMVFAVPAFLLWLLTRAPDAVQAARIAAVLEDPAPADEPAAYAPCASCHLHDGSGRPDGSIPRLTGQRRSVLENKLFRLRTGAMRLPVMDPFARSLAPAEIAEIAEYLSSMPELGVAPGPPNHEAAAPGASLFAKHCASCHGASAEGNDGLFASRLCGQYLGYLERRLDEAATRKRGDSDALMQGVVQAVPDEDLGVIVAWLAAGKGCASP